jgi:hypothetical protein
MNRSAIYYVNIGILTLIALLIIGYAIFSARHYLVGPQLIIKSPQNGQIFTEALIDVQGVATNIVYISLNDRAIYVDEQGNFREKLLLSPGYNIIKLYARDKFQREVTEQLEMVLKEAHTFPIPDKPNTSSTILQASSTATTTTEI